MIDKNNFYVVVDKDNLDVLSDWRFNNKNHRLTIGQIVGMVKYSKGSFEKGHNPRNSTTNFGNEISFEEFKEHILGERKEIEYEIY